MKWLLFFTISFWGAQDKTEFHKLQFSSSTLCERAKEAMIAENSRHATQVAELNKHVEEKMRMNYILAPILCVQVAE